MLNKLLQQGIISDNVIKDLWEALFIWKILHYSMIKVQILHIIQLNKVALFTVDIVK